VPVLETRNDRIGIAKFFCGGIHVRCTSVLGGGRIAGFDRGAN